MRLHRDTILRPQHIEIQRRHDGRERGGRRLMAANLHLACLAHMIGLMNRPGRQPQNAPFEFGEHLQSI